MNFTGLKSTLGIADGMIKDSSITISTNTLTANIDKLIRYCYDGQPIVIAKATLTSADDKTQTIILKGTSNFLLIPDLPVELHISIDNKSNVQLLLKYSLIGDTPKPDKWTFSRSFPGLPRVIDKNKPIHFDRITQKATVTEIVPLDDLYLFNSYYIVTTGPRQEPDFNVNLKWGINFVSHLRPLGFLGIIENVFKYTPQLTVYGTIRKPLPTETANNFAAKYPQSLEHFIYPWNIAEDLPEGLPGILLQVDLGLDYSIAKDNIQFKGEKLYIYTPLDDDWVLRDTNPKFEPLQAYTGKISLPGADIEVDMTAPVEIGVDEFQLIGFFEGVSLSNLSQMVGLTGSKKSPLDQLPDGIKKLGEKIGQLELTGASVAVDYTSLTNITVSYASFTIGMPQLNWQIWDDHFRINNIYCHFDIYYPFSTAKDNDTPEKRHYIVTVYGQLEIENVPFNVYAGNQDGFTVYGEMAEKQTLPLKKIMETYAPGIPAPSDLTIDTFRLGVAPGKEYTMALAMAGEPNPLIIQVGKKRFKIQDVSMGLTYRQGGTVSGSLGGTIVFGDIASLSIVYDIPGDIIVRSMIPEVSLKQLTDLLTNQAVSLPGDFDLTFKDSAVMMQKQDQNYMFQLGTQIEGFGSLAFQVQKVGAKWGFAAGLNMPSGLPSAIKGLEFFDLFEKFVTLQKFMIVVSSFDNPNFTFPDMAAFQVPAIASKQVTLPVQAGGVVAGLNIYAQWRLNMKDKAQKLLKNLLKLDSAAIGMTLQVGMNPGEQSRLYMSIDAVIANHPLTAKFGIQLEGGTPALFLSGSINVKIQKSLQTFDVVMVLAANGAFLSGTMRGPKPIDFEVFQLANLAVEVGINWGGIPSFGLAGSIESPLFDSSVAVFFDSADPSKSLVAGSLGDLTLADVLDTLTGNITPSAIDDVLDNFAIRGTGNFTISDDLEDALDNLDTAKIAAAFRKYGKITIPSVITQILLVKDKQNPRWYITDLTQMRHYQLVKKGDEIEVSVAAQFYCAPQATSIGSIQFPQGFYLNGTIEYYGFKVSATIEINTNKGIAVQAQAAPIVIFNKNFLSFTGHDGKGGPTLDLSTFKQPSRPSPELRQPHLCLSARTNILGLSGEDVLVSITKNGFQFSYTRKLPGGSRYSFNVSFDSLTNMSGSGSGRVGVKQKLDLGILGTINVNIMVGGSFLLSLKGKIASATFEGSFRFQDRDYSIGKFNLKTDASPLKDFAVILAKKILAEIRAFLDDVDQWLGWVEKGVVALAQGAAQAGDALKNVYKLSSNAIASKTKEALKYSANQTAQALKGAKYASGIAVKELKKVGYGAYEAGSALKSTFKTGVNDAAKMLKSAGYNAEQVGSALKNTFTNSASTAAKALKNAGFNSTQVGSALKGTFTNSAEAAGQALKAAGYTAEQTANVMKKTYGASAKAVSSFMKDTYKLSGKAAEGILKGVGYTSSQISDALKSVFDWVPHIKVPHVKTHVKIKL